MARVSLANRGRLSWLALRRGLDHAVARVLTYPLLGRPSWLRKADRLVIAPQDLRTADPTRAAEIYGGRFAFAGKIVVCDGRSAFEMMPPSDEWAEMLLSFGWLRHLRAAESTITRANARALVDEWITLQGTWHPVAWRPETVARRVIAWLTQATLILDDADVRFYRRFLRNLARQVRYLRLMARDTRDGVPRLQARIALAYASLTMSSQVGHLRKATRKLATELERQILPDGGHISRNPNALIEILLDLLPLSQAFTARNVPPPPSLTHAIDRMMPMLRFFRHGDGTFALFNGMGPTWPELIATILAYDDARGEPVANAPHSGYQRLQAGSTVLLMDTGKPPPIELSSDAHAGCLSFELSAKHQRIVVNCGLPAAGKESWRQVARATAAHSTVTFNDSSSCLFVEFRSFPPPVRHADRHRAGPCAGRARDAARRHHHAAQLTRRLCEPLRHRAPPHRPGRPRRRADRRRGYVHTAGRTGPPRQCARRVRAALPPAPWRQGDTPHRRARRDPGPAQQGRVEFHRARGSARSGGKRLPGRPGRPAPHRADRHPGPRAPSRPRALDAQPHAAADHRNAARQPGRGT